MASFSPIASRKALMQITPNVAIKTTPKRASNTAVQAPSRGSSNTPNVKVLGPNRAIGEERPTDGVSVAISNALIGTQQSLDDNVDSKLQSNDQVRAGSAQMQASRLTKRTAVRTPPDNRIGEEQITTILPKTRKQTESISTLTLPKRSMQSLPVVHCSPAQASEGRPHATLHVADKASQNEQWREIVPDSLWTPNSIAEEVLQSIASDADCSTCTVSRGAVDRTAGFAIPTESRAQARCKVTGIGRVPPTIATEATRKALEGMRAMHTWGMQQEDQARGLRTKVADLSETLQALSREVECLRRERSALSSQLCAQRLDSVVGAPAFRLQIQSQALLLHRATQTDQCHGEAKGSTREWDVSFAVATASIDAGRSRAIRTQRASQIFRNRSIQVCQNDVCVPPRGMAGQQSDARTQTPRNISSGSESSASSTVQRAAVPSHTQRLPHGSNVDHDSVGCKPPARARYETSPLVALTSSSYGLDILPIASIGLQVSPANRAASPLVTPSPVKIACASQSPNARVVSEVNSEHEHRDWRNKPRLISKDFLSSPEPINNDNEQHSQRRFGEGTRRNDRSLASVQSLLSAVTTGYDRRNAQRSTGMRGNHQKLGPARELHVAARQARVGPRRDVRTRSPIRSGLSWKYTGKGVTMTKLSQVIEQ